tara:strand:+ start:943 stop:1278 length:336 start_codon:yes stop_codon:yes gene_type:complete
MVWVIPSEIITALSDDIEEFMRITQMNDRQDALCCYIFGVLSDPTGLKCMYKLLVEHKGVPREIALKFLNYSLKMKYKMEKGNWSWYEMDKYNIPFEEVKECSTKYQLNFD